MISRMIDVGIDLFINGDVCSGRNIKRNSRAGYIIEGARRSRYHADHWFRYLRKVVSEQGALLSQDELKLIIASGELTMLQVITLKRALQPGTPTNRKVIALNQRTTTPMVAELSGIKLTKELET